MSVPIEFRDVYRHFDTKEVLKGLSFQVEKGQVFALLGRNGTGKTTAIRILLGLLQAMHGEARVFGKPSLTLSPEDRGRIAYISEGHRLYKLMRVRALLDFEKGTRPGFDIDFANGAIERCELPPKQIVGLLSRGQRAQLALILAIASRPEILIFDDPAMGLDTVMRREFLDATIELLSDRGISVLFSSHILTDVERIADRIGILKDGRLVVNASLDSIKQRVEKRFLHASGDTPLELPESDRILRARKRSGGYELTLKDCDSEFCQLLASAGAKLSDPVAIGLEDFFMDLTGNGTVSLLPDLTEVQG